ncbi:hypothetical protein MPTK1_1g11540 [Marchantia polymorpha subsp. ruderalis]|uniref:Uncharacterized protein n=2 Tax=Marchantia polymorpha TaxID=3197 RepID=A0AAF6AP17_MARPO|nr:hypothetical protein MARPO_0014s0072 [Marchantia polymorpha]BBM98187.1 hypothetical protein Mp_1g11540 [Marchantia polymorpha subsp. ruderalis]|eukprot:PTQ45535.1 hypothetical protein MARPO_0014s0072 [Marchantia polymorpha]
MPGDPTSEQDIPGSVGQCAQREKVKWSEFPDENRSYHTAPWLALRPDLLGSARFRKLVLFVIDVSSFQTCSLSLGRLTKLVTRHKRLIRDDIFQLELRTVRKPWQA